MEFYQKALIAAVIGCMGATLVACNSPEEDRQIAIHSKPREYTGQFRPICIDSVQYWQGGSGNASVLAPRFDPNTRQVKRCNFPELP